MSDRVTEYFNGSFLPSDVWKEKYQLTTIDGEPKEETPEDMHKRMAEHFGRIEKSYRSERTSVLKNKPELLSEYGRSRDELYEDKVFELFDEFEYIVPQGSIMSMLGNPYQTGSLSNCIVLPDVKDSYGAIMYSDQQLAQLMKRRCGVGLDVSQLRPEGASVRNAAKTSTGAVSFMHRFSDTTNEVAQCIEETQNVLTRNGLEEIKNVSVDDEVWTKRGWVSVEDTFESTKKVYRVKTSRGYTIETSKDHVFSVLDGDVIDNKKLDDLTVGDKINLLEGTPSTEQSFVIFSDKWEYEKASWNNSNRLNEDINIPEVLDEKFAYVLGVLYGDGHVVKSKGRNAGLSCAFHEEEKSQTEKFLDYFEDTFHYTFRERNSNNDEACRKFRMYSRKIVSFLNDNGLLKGKADSLSFPEKIKNSPVSVQTSFVAGYFDADGDTGSKGGYRFTSIDRGFIENVQKILFSLGITSKIHVEREDDEKWSTKHRLAVVGSEAQKRFVELIGEESVKTAQSGHVSKRDSVLTSYKAKTHDISHSKYSYVPGNSQFMSTSCFSKLAEEKDLPKSLIQDEIVDIRHVGCRKTVDLKLAEEHLFWCEGFYVHNSGRRGALMLTLDCCHPDMTRFVEEKDDPTTMTGANISAKWTDDFLEAVENDESYTLRFPVDADPDEAEITKEVNARELFKTASENAHIHGGDPGCMYIDRMEDYSTDCGYPNIRVSSTNPCVTGDTLIPTDQGLVEASVLAEKGPQKIVTDERIDHSEKYRETTDLGVYKTGVKDVYKVETKEGYVLRLTKNHKVKTDDGWVEIQNLQSNDKIHIRKQMGGFGNQGSEEKGRVLGWLVGDGFTSDNTAYLDFYTDEMHLGKPFADDVDQIVRSSHSNREYKANARKVSEDQVRIGSNRLYEIAEEDELDQNKLQVPHSVKTGNKSMQKGFLRSLFSADGSVQGSVEKGISVRLASKSPILLSETQQVLLNFGIYSTIYRERKSAGSRLLPNQKGGYSEYYTEGFHELVISKDDLLRFRDRIGFLLDRKQEELESLLDRYERGPYHRTFTANVENIEKDGKEEVYDLTEPETSSFIADGFVVHNCGEIGMYGGPDSCRLIAMNLMSVVENPFTDEASIDFDLLYKISYEQQRLLDNLVDLEVEAIDRIIEKVKSDPEADKYKRIEIETWEDLKESGEKYRRTGAGFTALGDMLAAIGVEYGSEQCDEVLHEVMSTKLEGEWDASTDLAIERGTFPEWDSQYDDTEFFDMLEEEFPEIYERNMEFGRRNISLSTVAPTGSVSLMSKIEGDFGTTSGIEPLFSTEKNKAWHTRNKRADGSEDYDYVDEEGNKWKQYPVFHNGFRIWMEENGYENPTEKPEEELKEIFKESPYITSAGLHWKDRLRTQGIVQHYVSHSISSTLNIPEDADVEETYKIYKNGRKYGLKGATIFRNGSKRGVLEGEDGGSSDENDITYHDAPERPEVLEADIHQVRYNGEPWKILVGRLEGKPYEVFAIKTGKDTGIRVRFTDSDDNKIEEGLIRKTDSGVYNFEAKDGKVVIEDIAEYAPDDNVRVDTRLLSLNLRHGVKPEYLVSQLEKADGSVVSFGRAILKALRSYLDVDPDDNCPECGEESLAFVESCLKCRSCGWSRC